MWIYYSKYAGVRDVKLFSFFGDFTVLGAFSRDNLGMQLKYSVLWQGVTHFTVKLGNECAYSFNIKKSETLPFKNGFIKNLVNEILLWLHFICGICISPVVVGVWLCPSLYYSPDFLTNCFFFSILKDVLMILKLENADMLQLLAFKKIPFPRMPLVPNNLHKLYK